jgi:hypothetical protein
VIQKLIRCKHVKKCAARKGISLRNCYFPLPFSFLLSWSEPALLFLCCLTQSILPSDRSHIPCPAVMISKIRLSSDVHGGDWSCKSHILRERERQTDRQRDCSLIFFLSSSVICVKTETTVSRIKSTVSIKTLTSWRTSSTIPWILKQTDTVLKIYSVSQTAQHRSSLFWDITQRCLVGSYRRFGTAYRSRLKGPSNSSWTA